MTLFKTWLVVGIAVFSVSFLVGFKVQDIKNNAIYIEREIYTYESNIKEQEDKRIDLIYRIADKIKKYDKNESIKIESVVDSNSSLEDMNDVKEMLSMISSTYKELNEDDSYNKLINDLSSVEELIIDYRNSYNDKVEEYNNYVENNPNKRILNMIRYEIVNY